MSARTIVAAPLVAFALALVSGCSDGDDSTAVDGDVVRTTAEASAGISVPVDDEPDGTTEVTPPSTPAASTPSSAPATTAAPTTTTTELARPFGDVPPIESTTPTDGNDPTPTLAWRTVDGAASYSVVVLDPAGAAWWAWEGEATEVILGGVADGPGALSTRPGTTWTVIAFDASGGVLAATLDRRLDP